MGPAPWPVNPSNAPVGQQVRRLNGQHCGEIVLVYITRRSTKLLEFRVEKIVFDYIDCLFSVDFEPLGPFAPIGEVDQGGHLVVVAPPSKGTGVVKGTHEAEPGSWKVVIDDAEVVQRNAGLR